MNDPDLQFRAGLGVARLRLHRARLAEAASAGLDRGLRTAAGATAVAAAVVVISRLAGLTLAREHYGFIGGAIGLAFVAPLLGRTIAAWRNKPTFDETAERLDLATANHNRVAIALELTRREQTSDFAEVAIRQGVESLNRVRSERPATPAARWRWKHGLGFLTAGAALLLIVFQLPVANFSEREDTQTQVAAHNGGPSAADAEKSPDAVVKRAQAVRPESPEQARAQSGAPDNSTGLRTGENAGPSTPSQAAAGPANAQQQPSPDTPRATERRRPPQTKDGPPQASVAAAVNSTLRQSAPSDARGSSAKSATGGKGSSLQPSLGLDGDKQQSQEHAQDGSRDAEAEDDIAADKNNESEHRGGLRPVLQDRAQSPSRDLGMSGSNKGPPGNGRGGPTPPKKSRGAGALLLGVPVPDFVQGRLLPGTSRLSRQTIPPQRQPGDPAAAADTANRSVNEPAVERFDAPSDSRDAVKRYFLTLHRDPDPEQTSRADTGANPSPENAP